MDTLHILAWIAAALVAVPVGVFVVECLAALVPRRRLQVAEDPLARPKLAVIVPAHNEEAGLGVTLESIVPHLLPGDRLVVVADNCTDGTAGVARGAGAEVVERVDDARRGKGYALAAGVAALRGDPPAVVLVIDADCRPQPGAVGVLAAAAAAGAAPVQGVYLMKTSRGAGPFSRLSVFAFMVKNLVRQRGMMMLGQPAVLQGTGMAFPWMAIDMARLNTGDIVEDLVIGLNMLKAGHAVRFCDAARFESDPAQQDAALAQRTRWEHGYLATMLHDAPRLMLRGLLGRPDLLAVALDLGVPPLSLLMLLYLGATAVAVVAGAVAGAWGPLILLGVVGLFFIGVLVVVCVVFGRGVVGLGTLMLSPLYAIWKLPIYLRFVTNPQTRWVRTARAKADTTSVGDAPSEGAPPSAGVSAGPDLAKHA